MLQGCEPQVLFNERVKCIGAVCLLLLACRPCSRHSRVFAKTFYINVPKGGRTARTDGHTEILELPQKL
ncbi:hypothetical protein MTO96_031784 [Rhipicephalus appendiculatus]